jgi:choline kinase
VSPVEHAVIAAAGLGSRLGQGRPKCLVEVHGRTILSQQLDLLRDVPDVRIVVGFEEEAVTEAARALRPDVVIVRNPMYRSTTTLDSYAMGARFVPGPCLFMDADIIFEPRSFQSFLEAALPVPVIGYTPAKTDDAVYVEVDEDGLVRGFSRTEPTPWEWANVAVLPMAYCETGSGAVYERLAHDLPLRGIEVQSWEVDRESDLRRAEAEAPVPVMAR